MLGASGVTQRSVLTRFQQNKMEKIVKKVGRKGETGQKSIPRTVREIWPFRLKTHSLTGGVYGNHERNRKKWLCAQKKA